MPNIIKNESKMDNILERASKGLVAPERLLANLAGMNVFSPLLHSKVDKHRQDFDIKGAKHLADTLVINKNDDASVSIGFSKAGKRSYIARFLNDGWEEFNQYGGPYGHHEGEYFWEKTEKETHEELSEAMKKVVKEIMDKKMGV